MRILHGIQTVYRNGKEEIQMLVKLSDGREIPVEMHKIKIVQKVNLVPVGQRLKAIEEGGYNTFNLKTRNIFLDMLTDSGTNAMSDTQLAAMMVDDSAYAGSESFYRLTDAINDVLGFKYVLPTHQGRACEHLIAKTFIKPGHVIPTNYHFTTTRAHFELAGGKMLEIYRDEGIKVKSSDPFKGTIDIQKLKDVIKKYGAENIPFVRMEATANLMGGQPFSMANLKEVKKIASIHKIPLVLDGSLLQEQAYFIKMREKGYENKSLQEILKEIMSYIDIFYLSARKTTSVRGGFIATNNKKYFDAMAPLLPLYEGFYTYGGMSTKEIEAMAVGLREITDIHVASCVPEQVKYFVSKLDAKGIPVVTPPGGLACHIDAKAFLPHVPQDQYTSMALTSAIYLTTGARSMERGTLSNDRDEKGHFELATLELARLAIPRRVFTLSHIEYMIDRIVWLYQHRDIVRGIELYEEPPVLRFFSAKGKALGNWGAKLVDAFRKELKTEY
jgi:tryptophanase